LPPLLIAFQQPEHVARLADHLVGLKPDLVLTQTPLDLDPEHHAVAAMVWQAFRAGKRHLERATLRFWTPGSSCQDGLLDPHYDHIEDISDHYEAKLALCRCHASQMSRVRLEMVEGRAALWGERIGVSYAEPFKTANV
jgi:LmbE family N-acetylglucosaminyl deacetylase